VKVLPLLACSLLVSSFAFADLVDSCSLTNKTACVLNTDQVWAEFLVTLPNYAYCGVKVLADTYPTPAVLAEFQAGLYVTAGPRWDFTFEQVGQINGNLTYPVGDQPLFATLFNVYTRNGQTLTDYVHSKLATVYRPNPTVVLIAMPCPR
jgi:hypothetical protein